MSFSITFRTKGLGGLRQARVPAMFSCKVLIKNSTLLPANAGNIGIQESN